MTNNKKPNPEEKLLKALEHLSLLKSDKYLHLYKIVHEIQDNLNNSIESLHQSLQKQELWHDQCLVIASKTHSLINRLSELTMIIYNAREKNQKKFAISELEEKIWKIIEKAHNAETFATRITELTKELLQCNTLYSLLTDIDTLKSKSWKLLEAIDKYSRKEFKRPVI